MSPGFWRMKKARYPAESVLGKLKGTMMYASCRNSIVFRNSEVLERLRRGMDLPGLTCGMVQLGILHAIHFLLKT